MNGLITQWGSVTLSDYKGAGDMEIVFGISFSNTRYAFTLMGIHSTFYTSTEEWAEEEWTKTKSKVSYTKRQRDYPLYKEFDWTAIGY